MLKFKVTRVSQHLAGEEERTAVVLSPEKNEDTHSVQPITLEGLGEKDAGPFKLGAVFEFKAVKA